MLHLLARIVDQAGLAPTNEGLILILRVTMARTKKPPESINGLLKITRDCGVVDLLGLKTLEQDSELVTP